MPLIKIHTQHGKLALSFVKEYFLHKFVLVLKEKSRGKSEDSILALMKN